MFMKCSMCSFTNIKDINPHNFYTHGKHNTNMVEFLCVQFDGGVRQHPVDRHELHTTSPHQVHVVIGTPLEKHTASHRRQHRAESQVTTNILQQPPPPPPQLVLLTHWPSFLAAPPPGVPPPPRLHTVLALRRRTGSPAAPPAAAPFTELSSETGAAPPTMAPQRHLRCPTTRGLLPSSAGAHPPGSSAKSPQNSSAGQWRQHAFYLLTGLKMDVKLATIYMQNSFYIH